MQLTIRNKTYRLLRNIGYCKNCKSVNESTHDWLIIECSCNTCIVSGGITYKARVYGANAINISEWLDIETGKTIDYNEICKLNSY